MIKIDDVISAEWSAIETQWTKDEEPLFTYSQVERMIKAYAKEVIDELLKNHVGYYEDGHCIYSGSSEYSAYIDEDRVKKFKEKYIDNE